MGAFRTRSLCASCCADEILADLIILNHMGANGPMRTTTRAERGRVTPRRSPRSPRARHGHGACGCARVGTGARGSRVRAGACISSRPRSRTADGGGAPLARHSRLRTGHSARCRVSRLALSRPRSDAYSLHLTGTGDTSHRRDTAAGAVTPLTTSGDLAPELDLRWRYAIHTRTAESPKEIVRRPVHGRLACGAWAGGSA